MLTYLLAATAILTTPDEAALKKSLYEKYNNAQTQYDKFDVWIQAIDSGVLKQGTELKTLDFLFGAEFAKHYPVRLLKSPTNPSSFYGGVGFDTAGVRERRGYDDLYRGWRLRFFLDRDDGIRSFYLNNMDKGLGPSYVENTARATALGVEFSDAESEIARLQVCIKAINERLITSHAPVEVVKEILRDIPHREIPHDPEVLRPVEKTKAMIVCFRQQSKGDEKVDLEITGWCFVYEYDETGVRNYYLTKRDEIE